MTTDKETMQKKKRVTGTQKALNQNFLPFSTQSISLNIITTSILSGYICFHALYI